MEFNQLVNYSDFKRQLVENITNLELLNNLIVFLNENIEEDNFLENFREIALAIYNEDVPIDIENGVYFSMNNLELSSGNQSLESIIDINQEYRNGSLPAKRFFIWQMYKMNTNIAKDAASYKDIANLNSEVNKILTRVDAEGYLSELFTQLGVTDLASEFLFIHNHITETTTRPGMLSTDRIFIYSALLNYTYSHIALTTNYKTKVQSYLTPELYTDFEKLRKYFLIFLEEIRAGTINY